MVELTLRTAQLWICLKLQVPAQETTQTDFPQVSLQFGEACHENVILSPGTRTELRKTNSATTADRTAEQIDAHLHTLSLCNTVIHCNIHIYIYIVASNHFKHFMYA